MQVSIDTNNHANCTDDRNKVAISNLSQHLNWWSNGTNFWPSPDDFWCNVLPKLWNKLNLMVSFMKETYYTYLHSAVLSVFCSKDVGSIDDLFLHCLVTLELWWILSHLMGSDWDHWVVSTSCVHLLIIDFGGFGLKRKAHTLWRQVVFTVLLAFMVRKSLCATWFYSFYHSTQMDKRRGKDLDYNKRRKHTF